MKYQTCDPPNSPDTNSLDYHGWGVIEKKTNKQPYNIKESLKAAIADIMDTMVVLPYEELPGLEISSVHN
ncbi:hypothetical protein TNCT_251641 [Trichonephila clavata]|uniref:Uncharacterized protein n=1 Tax=Trichonephila clavata TaxID=2740835 RepID=A0A8X6J114_TRICU|nr:hypothetical protein TNCT_251641 [Trichonephila clavata]